MNYPIFIINFPVKKQQQGFTLIELLIVILIMGILSAISLPVLIGAVGRARESEAKQGLNTLGEVQQAYFFEHKTFANQISELDANIEAKNYTFEEPTLISADIVKHKAIANNGAKTNTRNYELGVYYISGGFNVVLCESLTPDATAEASTDFSLSCLQGKKIQ